MLYLVIVNNKPQEYIPVLRTWKRKIPARETGEPSHMKDISEQTSDERIRPIEKSLQHHQHNRRTFMIDNLVISNTSFCQVGLSLIVALLPREKIPSEL
jgi:hypothetical protein